ncbi:MAG: polysaccharide biosynthesis protein [Bacteroidetes bacterium GWF2_33_16]|nr:MAG: polysaccharide biosynthesis protein [Bacteroidetes bacterium GWE2_32_14]OFY03676.1 MAG: polysaccharide biosynthesis protein [Bacteroidetes bacterium GWF2_33_16]
MFPFPKTYVPRWIVFLIDLGICTVSITLAFLLRFNFAIPENYVDSLSFILPLVLFIRSLTFLIFRSYAGIIRYSGARDTERIFYVTITGSFTFIVINLVHYYLINATFIIPFSVIAIDFLASVFFLASFRLITKILYHELNNPSKEKTDVIIYGAGQFGIITKRTLDRDAESKHKVLAFLDDTPSNIGKTLEGVTIYHPQSLDMLLEKNEVEKLIIASEIITTTEKQEVIEKCLQANIKVLSVPDINTWINGELSFNQIKEIKIEDLLERPPIVLDINNIRKTLLNKCILVTGAAGSIGSEIVRQLISFNPKKIILFDQAESPLYDMELDLQEKHNFYNFEIVIGNIADDYRVKRLFEAYKPSIVFHAAAYKHVPMMENNPTEALRTNVMGTKIIADISNEYNVERFVMVSTDKAVNPTNVMGASKRIAEIYIQAFNQISKTNFITTRFGNVLGSNGSAILRFKKQIEKGGPVTVTHPDVTRYFMTIPEACQLVLEAGAMSKGGEVFIFDMGKSVKIIDLAKKMIKLSGLLIGKDIQIKFTGLRPGEKLYEELLCDTENTLPTYHSKIMIAKVPDYNFESIKEKIQDLIKIQKKHNNFDIVKKMKEIVPEFKSQNSVYEELDIEFQNQIDAKQI